MSRISQYLAAIKSAIYGEEVRGAIHDAIEQNYTDMDNAVEVSETKPTDSANKLWIQPIDDEMQIPTWEEFEDMQGNIENAVSDWIEEHPEVVTTVPDYSITESKISSEYARMLNTFTVDRMSDILNNSFSVGHYIRTNGFNNPGDNGGALYEIVPYAGSSYSEADVDDCSVFRDAGGNFVVRIFDKPYVYLESMNIGGSASFDTIIGVITSRGIKDVRCGSITTNETIYINYTHSYNFTFDTITYTGYGYALEINNVQDRIIRGNKIIAKSHIGSSGVAVLSNVILTKTDDIKGTLRNKIDIRYIETSGHCVDIIPSEGRGIMHNHYIFGKIVAKPYGMEAAWKKLSAAIKAGTVTVPSGFIFDWSTENKNSDLNGYFPANYLEAGAAIAGISISIVNEKYTGTGTVRKLNYSWEGEDFFSVSDIEVSNTEEKGHGTAKALSITLAKVGDDRESGKAAEHVPETIDNNASICGTITGITFDHLAVEYSDIGIYIRSGTANPGENKEVSSDEAGIKSVRIENMRSREHTRTKRFIDAEGWLRDIYIKPTSKISYSRWVINNASNEYFIVDAPILNSGKGNYTLPVGYTLVSVRGITYIRDRMPHTVDVSPNSTVSDLNVMYTNVEDVTVIYGSTEKIEKAYIGDFAAQCEARTISMPDKFYIMDGFSAKASDQSLCRVRLNLSYKSDKKRSFFYNESARDLRISVPAKTVVDLQFTTGSYRSCSITNNDTVRNEYSVSARRDGGTSSNDYDIIKLT